MPIWNSKDTPPKKNEEVLLLTYVNFFGFHIEAGVLTGEGFYKGPYGLIENDSIRGWMYQSALFPPEGK